MKFFPNSLFINNYNTQSHYQKIVNSELLRMEIKNVLTKRWTGVPLRDLNSLSEEFRQEVIRAIKMQLSLHDIIDDSLSIEMSKKVSISFETNRGLLIGFDFDWDMKLDSILNVGPCKRCSSLIRSTLPHEKSLCDQALVEKILIE